VDEFGDFTISESFRSPMLLPLAVKITVRDIVIEPLAESRTADFPAFRQAIR
jgi:hypothetical protein